MRIRTIKPEFFTHEGLYEAEAETKLPLRVAFAGLWCVADRDGRFKWEPRRIGIAVLPYDRCEFSRVLDALTTRGFVVKYRVGGVYYGVIPSFSKHQVINNREKDSELPEPSLADDSDATVTREPRVSHASKEEGKGREWEGEGNGKECRVDSEDSFSKFWTAYPRRVGKANAEAAWKKHGCEAMSAQILTAVARCSASPAWRKDAGQFIPHPATWLNRRGWEDELGPIGSGIRENLIPHIINPDDE